MTEQERKYYEELKENPNDWNFDSLFNTNEKGEAITKEGTWFRLMGDGLPMFFPTATKRIDLLNEITTSTFQNKSTSTQTSSSKMTSVFEENTQPEGSIFSWENPDETPSWYDIAMNRHNESFPKKTEAVSRYDFLPIVKINNSEEAKNAIISIKECENCKKEKVNLGTSYEEDKQEYIVAEIIITQNSTTKIPLILKRGYDPIGLQDEDGILKFTCNNDDVKIKMIDNDDTDYDKDEKEYDLKDVAYGDEFVLEIEPTKLKRGSKFTITFSASDDGDGLGTTSKRVGICGKFNFTIIQDDVFTEAEVNSLLLELKYIKPFADEYSPSEYAGNYCMAGAERGLSELLKNTKDFYSVERETHKRKNKISFSNLNADDRANTFNKLGYINSKILIPTKDFSISLNKNFELNNKNKQKDRGTIIKAKDPKKIYALFENIKNKIGFHIYYCSIAGANHTMILVINNIKPCDSKFEFWDEHGLSSSLGKLQNIGNGENGEYGISMQVQWLVRLLRGWKKDNGAENADTFYPSLDCNLYKIQR